MEKIRELCETGSGNRKKLEERKSEGIRDGENE